MTMINFDVNNNDDDYDVDNDCNDETMTDFNVDHEDDDDDVDDDYKDDNDVGF